MVLEQQLQDADSAQLLGISAPWSRCRGCRWVRHLPLPLGSVVELDAAGELPSGVKSSASTIPTPW